MHLKTSTLQEEGSYRASKWLSFYCLFSDLELQSIIEKLEVLRVFNLSQVGNEKKLSLDKLDFFNFYKNYLEAMRLDQKEVLGEISKAMNLGVCFELEDYYKLSVGDNRFIIKNKAPIIQIHPFSFRYDRILHKFFDQAKSSDAIFFGLEFKFPQIYQDPKTSKVIEVYKEGIDINAKKFKILRRFIKDSSRPARFLIDGEKKVATFRVGLESKKIAKEQLSLKDNQIQFMG